jgi:hypothetical protein
MMRYRVGNKVRLRPEVIDDWVSSESYTGILTLYQHPYEPGVFRVYRNDVKKGYSGCASAKQSDILCLANPIILGGE